MKKGFIRSSIEQSYRNRLWFFGAGTVTTILIAVLLVSNAPQLKINSVLVIGVALVICTALLWNMPETLNAVRHFPPDNPITIELSRFGEPETIADEVDAELLDHRDRIGAIGITANWLIYPGLGTLSLVRLDEIVWVYKHVLHYRTHGGRRMGDKWALIIWDKQKVGLTITDYEETVSEILQALAERVPWAVFGYSAEREAAWKSDPEELIGAVEKRMQEVTKPLVAPADNL